MSGLVLSEVEVVEMRLLNNCVHLLKSNFPYIDGVVSAYNPALAPLNLAIKINQSSVSTSIKQKSNLDKIRQLEDIAILSIGTG